MDVLPTKVEMRCFQVSKGGMKYELVMPVLAAKSKKPVFPVSKAKTSSLQEMKRRQEQAETRRLYQRNTRIPSQHLDHIEKVRETKKRSISDFRSFVKKESEQRIKKSEISREDRIKSIQVRKKTDQLRPQTAPVNEIASFEAKCLEEHLNIQTRLLGELNIQATKLIQAIKELGQKNP